MPQQIEGFAVITTADLFRYLLWKLRAPEVTEVEGGLPTPEPARRSFLDKLLFSIQGLATLLPPAVYCTAVVFNRFQQPAWMLKFALPEDIVPPEWKAPLRLAACVAGVSLKVVLRHIFSHSDERWRMIGVGSPVCSEMSIEVFPWSAASGETQDDSDWPIRRCPPSRV